MLQHSQVLFTPSRNCRCLSLRYLVPLSVASKYLGLKWSPQFRQDFSCPTPYSGILLGIKTILNTGPYSLYLIFPNHSSPLFESTLPVLQPRRVALRFALHCRFARRCKAIFCFLSSCSATRCFSSLRLLLTSLTNCG